MKATKAINKMANRLTQYTGHIEVQTIDDFTVIPVKVKFPDGTTQILEDGIIMDCDHSGAELDTVDLSSLYYDPILGTVENSDNTRVGLVCDKCDSWQDENGEWYE